MKLEDLLKENSDINITVKASDLIAFAHEIAKEILQNHKERLYTQSEVKETFDICDATLWRWNKLGIIKSKKICNRRYYPESEILRLTKGK